MVVVVEVVLSGVLDGRRGLGWIEVDEGGSG